MTRRRWWPAAVLAVTCASAAGCASVPVRPAFVGPDGVACVMDGTHVPAQVAEVANAELLAAALGRTGEGRICAGQTYRVRAPLRIYRVWDGAKQNTYGEWWALAPPRGDRDDYRRAYAVCPEWNALDRLAACTLKAGAQIVLGPGQSATCADQIGRAHV